MIEGEPPGMQRVTLELDRPQRPGTVGVALFADQRVSAQPRLEADLVAAAGREPDLDQRRVAEALDRPVIADRICAARIAGMRLLLDERLLVPDQPIRPAP